MTNHQYGPNGHIVDAFLEHLEGMTEADWLAVIATWQASDDSWYAASYAALSAAGSAAGSTAAAALKAAGPASLSAARCAAGYAARYAAGYAVCEILGADLLRERGQPFFFLPMFGFADEQAIIKAGEHLK